jgi:dynein heavy chain
MSNAAEQPNAVIQCTATGMLETVTCMDDKLETIQKSLDSYLETKRDVFPRFYFVSDDDLLEILGQSREPLLVQKHIKKCFEGFKVMDIIPPGKQLNRNFEVSLFY